MFKDRFASLARERAQQKNVRGFSRGFPGNVQDGRPIPADESLAERNRARLHLNSADMASLFLKFKMYDQLPAYKKATSKLLASVPVDLQEFRPLVDAKKIHRFIKKSESQLSASQAYAIKTLDYSARLIMGLGLSPSDIAEQPSGYNWPFYHGYLFAKQAMQTIKGARMALDSRHIMRQRLYAENGETDHDALVGLRDMAMSVQPELCEVITGFYTQQMIAPFKPLSEEPSEQNYEYDIHLDLMRAGAGLAYMHACESADSEELYYRTLMLGYATIAFN